MMKHRGIRWSEDELTSLKTLYSQGVIVSEIVRRIGRSESAVQKKAKELGLIDRKNIWTDEEKQELVKLFQAGIANGDIATSMGRSIRSVQAELVRLGYKRKNINVWANRRRDDFWSDDEVKTLKELVASGLSAREVSIELRRSIKGVFWKLSELGLSIAEKTDEEESLYRRAYSLDDNYFENVNTQMKAYFLGWMITDGWVSDYLNTGRNGKIKSNKIGLKLMEVDKYVLEEFKKELKCDAPLKYHKPRNSVFRGKTIKGNSQFSIEFSSVKMQKDLLKYGVGPRKTYIAVFPSLLAEEYYPGFIAGVISGDGSIDIKRNHGIGFLIRCSIAGTKDLLEGIKKALVKNISFNQNKNPMYKKNTKCLYILELNQTETINLYKWFTKNNVKMMPRKQKIIEDYINGLEGA